MQQQPSIFPLFGVPHEMEELSGAESALQKSVNSNSCWTLFSYLRMQSSGKPFVA
jgi:hypothetical protein